MAEPAITQDEQSLKQRAMRRLAIALTVIAVAIVTLALLDRYNASQKKTEPVVPPPREAPAPLATPAPPSTPAPSTEQRQTQRPPPPPPVVENQQPPYPPQSGAPESSGKKMPGAQNAEKSAAAPTPEAKTAAPAPELKLSVPSPKPPTTTPPGPSEAAATNAANKGFIVQVGVFMSATNARTLQNKLADKGIPTHTETRVVVGPFKDRAEAEAVIRQLKELGANGVVVPPPAAQ